MEEQKDLPDAFDDDQSHGLTDYGWVKHVSRSRCRPENSRLHSIAGLVKPRAISIGACLPHV